MLVGISRQHLRLLNRKATVKEAVKEVRFAASVNYPCWDNDTIKFVGQLGAKEGLFGGRSEHTIAKWCQVVSQWDSYYCMLQLDLEKICYQYTKALKVDFVFKWKLSLFFFLKDLPSLMITMQDIQSFSLVNIWFLLTGKSVFFFLSFLSSFLLFSLYCFALL